MEVRFEMKVANLDFVDHDHDLSVLFISSWFKLAIRKSAEESKYYIDYTQKTSPKQIRRSRGLVRLESNLIKFSKNWKKVCRLIFKSHL